MEVHVHVSRRNGGQVTSANSQISTGEIVGILASIRQKGVRLWSENGQLHYKAPNGTLAQADIEYLRAAKDEIIALLERVNCAEIAEPNLEPRPRRNRAPLAFSQQQHWNLYQLDKRRVFRGVASVSRLRGRLNINALRKSLAEIVRRHEALRTRIIVYDGIPTQEISESYDCDLSVDDLTYLSGSSRDGEVKRLTENYLLEAIDVAVDPLFGARLLRVRDDEHVLILAMEHMIADAFSLQIILRELLTAYIQASKGHVFSLPEIFVQFADYAAWQRNSHKSWIERHDAYWNERLTGVRRLRFPEDTGSPNVTRSGWGIVPFQIGKNLKAEFRELCRLRRTTLVMGVFTAYVGFVLRWCNASESVIQFQSDARISPKIENTVGYFASVLFLRVAIFDDDSFVNLMNQAVAEYCKAYEHSDFSYIAAQMPRPEFTRNTLFNWVPQGHQIDLSALGGLEDQIICSSVPFAHPMLKRLELDSEPGILLHDVDDEVIGYVYFPLNRFSIGTMEEFAHDFLVFIRALLREPDRRVRDLFRHG